MEWECEEMRGDQCMEWECRGSGGTQVKTDRQDRKMKANKGSY